MPKTGPLRFDLETQAQALFMGWIRHFRTQDESLTYQFIEKAAFTILPTDDRFVILTGILDAEGPDFFSEFKTANPRSRAYWKKEWIMSPQALTYGLLTGGKKKFLVRKAFKSKVPEYDHEWFQFTPGELEMWKREVLLMAAEIQSYEQSHLVPWPLNFGHGCFAYGPNYPCPLWQSGCSKLNFNGDIPGSTIDREELSEFEGDNRALLMGLVEEVKASSGKEPIILTQSAIMDWQRCRELFRRVRYLSPAAPESSMLSFPSGEAALIGARFHELVSSYNERFIKKAA